MHPDLILAAATGGGWGTVQTIVLLILAVVSTITTALVGIQIGTVRTLRDSNKDLRDRVADLEKERMEDKAEILKRDGLVNEKDSENQLLKAMVTGKVEWIAVTDQLENHHREAIDHWTSTEHALGAILATLQEKP